MLESYKKDLNRMEGVGHKSYLKRFFWLLRHAQETKNNFIKKIFRLFFHIHALKHQNEIGSTTKIGYGFCLWHPYNITITPSAIIGNNVTLNKGVVIGREFRGSRRGCPMIGNEVWIGANAVVVGKINVGNDVLIAPNAFVNFDVPDHSIVIGNPGKIIHSNNATLGYIQNKQAIK